MTRGAKHQSDFAQDGIEGEKRVDVFPDDLTICRHLKQAAEVALRDERVAVWQALSASYERTEEVEDALIDVLPDDFVRRNVDFDHARVVQRAVFTVAAVVADEDVTVGWLAGMVLLLQFWR